MARFATFLTRDRRNPTSTAEAAGEPDYWFGVDIRRVREIGRFDHIAPVPRAAAAVLGLCNLRGQLVTILDLGSCVGVGGGPSLAAGDSAACVILKPDPATDDGPAAGDADAPGESSELVGLRVDEIGDVVEVAEPDVEAVPRHLGPEGKAISGVVRFPNRLLVMLNLKEVLRAGGAARKEDS